MSDDADLPPSPRAEEPPVLRGEEIPAPPRIERITLSRRKVIGATWRGKEINDLNALKTVFENCDFRYSNFKRGYFRDARFVNCMFDGVRFDDCNFKSANFYGCELQYAHFHKSVVEVREIVASLPAAPNIRRESLQNLKANAIEVGDHDSIGYLVLQEISATERHYSYAMCAFDTYYRNKYSTLWAKVEAGMKLLGLKISGLVWGHGEKPWRLLISCLTILVLLGFVNFWSVMPRIGWNDTHRGVDVIVYVFRRFLDVSPDGTFKGFEFVDVVAVIMRYVYIGLFISILYKSISHR